MITSQHAMIFNVTLICVAVACGVRLSCSVFTVYSVLLSVSLVARAIPMARRLQVYKRREHHDM